MLQGRQMAPIQLDSITMLVEETAGWAHHIDIRPVIDRERFYTDHFLDSIWKDLLFVMGKAFVYITLWYTKTAPSVLLCGVHTVLIPCRSHQTRW